MDAADTRAELDLHSARKRIAHRAKRHCVDVDIGEVLGEPGTDTFLAHLLQDGPEHAVRHVVEQRFGIELFLRVALEIVDLCDRTRMIRETDRLHAFAGDVERLLGTLGAVIERFAFDQSNGAHGAHPRGKRPGFEVGDGVAARGGELRDVVGVHMTGEDIAHTRIRKPRCHVFPVLYHVLGKDLILHREVRHKPVVHKADNRVAFRLGFLRLTNDPRQQILVDTARGHMLVRVVAGVGVGAIHSGVDCHNGKLAQIDGIRKATRLLAGCCVGVGEVLRIPVSVVAEVPIDLLELVGSRGFGAFLLAIRESTRILIVVDVVVAVDDEDFGVGFVLDLLEPLGQLLVAELLAVLREVAGDQQHVGLILPHHIERRVQDRARFLEHLGIAAHVGFVIFAIAHVGKRVVVRIGQDGDLDIGVSRGVVIGIARRGLSGVLRGLVGKCRKGGKPSHRQRQRQRQNRRKRRAEPANDRVFQVIFHPQPLPIVHCDRALERGAFGCEIPERNAVER